MAETDFRPREDGRAGWGGVGRFGRHRLGGEARDEEKSRVWCEGIRNKRGHKLINRSKQDGSEAKMKKMMRRKATGLDNESTDGRANCSKGHQRQGGGRTSGLDPSSLLQHRTW